MSEKLKKLRKSLEDPKAVPPRATKGASKVEAERGAALQRGSRPFPHAPGYTIARNRGKEARQRVSRTELGRWEVQHDRDVPRLRLELERSRR